MTKPFDRQFQIERTILRSRRFLEEVLVEIRREGEDAFWPESTNLVTSNAGSSVALETTANVPAQIQNTLPVTPGDNSTESDAKPLYADELYEKVKNLVQTTNPLDAKTARIIVETSDDAISEFRNTNQEKKLDLRKWKAEAEAVLPPLTLKELKERAEAQILAKSYPRRNLPRKIVLYIIGVGIIAAALATVYKEYLEPRTKPPVSAEQTQPRVPRVQKEQLLAALRERVLTKKELIGEVKTRGVDFRLTGSDEQQIREAGKYLGQEGLDDLLAAVRDSDK